MCIKGGTNRIHITKMASVITPLYLASFIVFYFSIALIIKNKNVRTKILPSLILLSTVYCVFAQLDFNKLLFQTNFTRAQLSSYRHRLDKSDDSWLNEDTKLVKEYITRNTSKNDYVFSFTSDPLYYYVVNRKNPSRFYISWYADPQPYTDELLADLKSNMPSLIIFNEMTSLDNPDGIFMEYRLPEINEWIKYNYKKEKKIGRVTLLER